MNQSILHQSVRYGLVGGCVFLTDFLVYLAVLFVAPGAYLAGNVAGKAAGAALGFVLHKRFTFSWRQKDPAHRQLASYAALFAANLLLSSFLLWLLAGRIGIGPVVAKLAVDVIVIATSFIVSRAWVYRAA